MNGSKFKIFHFRTSCTFPITVSILGVFCFISLFPAVSFPKNEKFIPVPAVTTSRNDGVEYGILVSVLSENEKGEVNMIIAPSLTYNEFVGMRGTFRFFRYGKGNRDYTVIVSSSAGIDQKVLFRYSDPNFYGKRFALTSEVTAFKDSTRRFYGFSADSSLDNETNFTQNEFAYDVLLGYYFSKRLSLSFGEKLRWISIRPGSVETEPYFRDIFPNVPGGDGGLVFGHRLVLAYDTRDDLSIPSHGILAGFYGELGHTHFESRELISKTGLDVRGWFPMKGGLLVTAVRGAVQFTTGRNNPFFEKATLGGDETLRNFGESRFIDDHFYLINIEERIRLIRFRLFGILADWEFATFVDFGRVFGGFDRLLDDIQINPGFGIRALVRPNVVGRFDAGFGPEGLTLFVGLDYPF